MVAFKGLLHQSMAALFGIVYGALSIDIIKYDDGPSAVSGERVVDAVLRCLDCDQSLLLQTLPTIASYGGHHLELVTRASTPALFALV